MNIAYYPGCALNGTSKEYNESVKALCKALGLTLDEVKDWNCCGASAAHMTDADLNLALNARNLALAEGHPSKEILAPCPLCSGVMMKVQQELKDNPEKLDEIKDLIEKPEFQNDFAVLNIMQALEKVKDEIAAKLNNPLKGMKVASYYGCYMVRPPNILKFDDPENPMSMDNFVESLGFEPVDWAFKTECCGAGFTISNPDSVIRLATNILEDAKANGAEIIAVACPMCQANLDLKQPAAAAKLGWGDDRIPIIYVTQLAGLAIGLDYKELGLHRHMVSTKSVTDRCSGGM